MAITFNDIGTRLQLGFQDPASSVMEGIIDLHHHVMVFLILILVTILWVLFRIIQRFKNQTLETFSSTNHGTALELVWTIIPCIILFMISLPSFAILYSLDDFVNPSLTIQVIGHQWYWSYEITDFAFSCESYMVPERDLSPGDVRLLDVDNALVLPHSTHIRVLVSSDDVIHSWAIPSLGIKIDALPGRINQVSLLLNRKGLFYGQCSELCGVLHGFMPIVIKSTDYTTFLEHVLLFLRLAESLKVLLYQPKDT